MTVHEFQRPGADAEHQIGTERIPPCDKTPEPDMGERTADISEDLDHRHHETVPADPSDDAGPMALACSRSAR